MSFPRQVKSFILKQQLCSRGDKVIVGVSGGSDSICLLHILNQLKHELGISLIVAHYNHGLRKEAGEDQKFVQQIAESLELPFVTDTWKGSKKNLRGSIEDLARKKRLAFFQKIASQHKTHIVSLAHTQDDLAETVLMRLMRGSGLKGLRSILPRRTIDGLIIIRPLLEISKKEILKYIKQQSLKFREDSTNRTTVFFRNKIRLQLMPLLEKEYNPNIVGNLVNFAKHTDIDYNFIEQESKKAFQRILLKSNPNSKRIDLKKFTQLHPAIQHSVVNYILNELDPNVQSLESRHMTEMDELITTGKPLNTIIHLPHRISVKKLSTSLNFELH